MVRTRRAAAPLKAKSIESLKLAVAFFNGSVEEGRHTAVYLFLQHSCEMLLKACAIQRGFDILKDNGHTVTLYECLRDYGEDFGLSESDIGSVKIVDKARNDYQHYHTSLDESLVYVQVQSIIPVISKLLFGVFGEKLGDYVPDRVIPLSTVPIQGVELILDTQMERIRELLAPGNRRRDEARAMIRGLVSMEAFDADDLDSVTEANVDRILHGILDGEPVENLLPTLTRLSVAREGYGSKIAVRFTKSAEVGAVPFKFSPDDDVAVLVSERDLSGNFNLTKQVLNTKLGLTNEKGAALRWHLQLVGDRDCHRVETHNKSKFDKFTPEALRRMRCFLENGGDISEVVHQYRMWRKTGTSIPSPQTPPDSLPSQAEP